MAWRTTKVEDQRKKFIDAVLASNTSFSDLCNNFEISRRTGYKWVARFNKEGINGLKDRSRAPLVQAKATDAKIIEEIIKLKLKYSKWGPKKVQAKLKHLYPLKAWPSTTTIGKILKENGLTLPKKYRKRFPAKTNPLSHCQNLNDIWSIDFKGWFKTKDGIKCEPLTLTDAHSRFILRCIKLPLNNAEYVWALLDSAFREYGLPLFLRHDNGPPFATCSVGRLSPLSIKLIKAGVIPEWIEPSKPYQNGRHERMHLTLKEEGVFPHELTLKEQQIKFKEFQNYYNFERPHEALNQKTPGSIYKPSQRVWNGILKAPEYSKEFQIKRIRESGQIKWKGKEIYISKALGDENIGLRENEENEWEVYFGSVFLGKINQEKELIIPERKNRKSTNYKEIIF